MFSESECRMIIKKCIKLNNFQVLNYTIHEISEAPNVHPYVMITTKIKLLSNCDDKDLKFLAKRYKRKDYSEYKELCTFEIFFEKLRNIPEFTVDFAPDYYFSQSNDLIVFQNCSETGYSLPEDYSKLDIDHIQVVLRSVAKLHAGSILVQEINSNELGRKYKLIDEYPDFLQEPVFKEDEKILGYKLFQAKLKSLHNLIDSVPANHISSEAFIQKVQEIAANSFKLMEAKSDVCNVVCHGDLQGKNCTFKYQNGAPIHCELINFNLIRYGPPAHDVLCFIYSTTTTDTRKHHLQDLLEYYYSCLKLEVLQAEIDIAKIMSFEEFVTSAHKLLPQVKLEVACDAAFNYETLKKNELAVKYQKRLRQYLEDLYFLVSYQGLTMEDCFQIVKNKTGTTDYQLVNCEITPLGKFCGYLGDHNKCKITIKDSAAQNVTIHLFAKFMPSNKSQSAIAIDCDAFHQEIFVYTKFFPSLRKLGLKSIDECVAPCYFTRTNDVLVFEDLERQNYSALNTNFELFSLEQLKIVVTTIAKFHACGIVFEMRMREESSPKFCLREYYKHELTESLFIHDESKKLVKSTMVGLDAFQHMIDLFPDECVNISQGVFKDKAKKACNLSYELVKPSKQFLNVFSHGDLWFSNVMLKQENGRPVDSRLIDFQILRYCPPTQDLLFFIYMSTNRETRPKYLQVLIDFYYNELAKVLLLYNCDIKDILPYEEFIKSCKYITPQVVCHMGAYIPLIVNNNDLLLEFTSSEERSHKMFLVDRSDFIDTMCAKDPVYKERIRAFVCDLRDMCEAHF